MLNGRYDLFYRAETDQIPMFHSPGTQDKNRVLFDSGRVPIQPHEIKETMDWFDRYLGPASR